jgi:transcriptional regulator with XRE-family HTH domain
MTITPPQCRAARALLGWTQPRLAARAEIGLSTVSDFEHARRVVSKEAIAAIQRSLATAGIVFDDNDGCEPGVVLRKTT